jgi:hypothetical protein
MNYKVIVARVMAALLAIISIFSGTNILPAWADAQGVNLLNGAALAVGLLIQYIAAPVPAPAPVDSTQAL